MKHMGKEIKLSDYLRDYHNSGDCGEAFEGLSEEAKNLEDLLLLCCKDLYSGTWNFKKKTARALYDYVNKHDIDI